MLISEKNCEAILAKLEASLGERVRGPFQLEVQDGGVFLLVVAVAKTQTTDKEAEDIVECMASVVGPIVPPRAQTYSWMVMLKEGEEVRSVRESKILD